MKSNSDSQAVHRRQFMKWVGMSSLALTLPFTGCEANADSISQTTDPDIDVSQLKNIFDLKSLSAEVMGDDAQNYLNGGADDLKTVDANRKAFDRVQIRARRLVDVRTISTEIEIFGRTLDNPILLCPVGFQGFFHPDGEIGTAKAAKKMKHQMIASSVSNFPVGEIAGQSQSNIWFQLYPTPDREITKILLANAEKAGCDVCFLTVDTPVVGNRENHGTSLMKMIESGELEMGNFKGILPKGMTFSDPGMTWDMIDWIKANSNMRVVLKGIVTREDARIAVDRGADGIMVSNHGGRQLESNRATIDCLPEVVDEVNGKIPVIMDGGIRRGTDIFKALALGAMAVGVGRPFCWGLGALGQQGVEIALEILKTELIRDMRLAGTTSIEQITRNYIAING